jgi:hypothetical protein
MKVVHLQISRVVSQNDENEPIYDTHVIKLNEGYPFVNFLKQLPVLGLVKSKTMVVKVVENKEEVNKDPFQKMVIEAMATQKQPIQGDLSIQLEVEKKRNKELEARLEALENMINKPEKDSEKEQLIADYIEMKGKEPDKRWSAEKLKNELNK